jgi:hypothetical protein
VTLTADPFDDQVESFKLDGKDAARVLGKVAPFLRTGTGNEVDLSIDPERARPGDWLVTVDVEVFFCFTALTASLVSGASS